ncbi:MAG: hypothetical protein JWO86_5860 [Myxococcaceae bacterium]|nr:hypothetical protein [Myxococcaceae bacterium]
MRHLAYIGTRGYHTVAPGFPEAVLADWYVYQHDGDPLGPWSTDSIADAILAGKLAPDVWVAAPGGPRWLRALDVPVIGRLVDGIPTKPKRRDSGLRLMPAAFVTESSGMPAFGSTMMMVTDEEVQLTDSERSAIESSNVPLSKLADRVATVPMTARSPADETAKMSGWMQRVAGGDLVVEDDPPTEPALPPSSSSTPKLPRVDHDTAEAPSTDRRRRRKNA